MEINKSISDKQNKKINQDYKKIPKEDIISSVTFQALKRDIDLFDSE